MTFRNRASVGKRQEYRVIAELLQREFDVYMTLVDDQGIDCIIRNSPDKYLDIQIKARSKDALDMDAGRFAAMKIDNPRSNYFFIFYSEKLEKYWILSLLELTKLASRNKQGKNVGKYHINFAGSKKGEPYALEKYKQYEDNYQALK